VKHTAEVTAATTIAGQGSRLLERTSTTADPSMATARSRITIEPALIWLLPFAELFGRGGVPTVYTISKSCASASMARAPTGAQE
jgi:hypothetical protein